jgi:hypothetical protein
LSRLGRWSNRPGKFPAPTRSADPIGRSAAVPLAAELAQRLLRLLYLVAAGLRSVIALLPLLLCCCAGDDLLIDFFADAACCAYAGASAAMETRVTPVSCARRSAVT